MAAAIFAGRTLARLRFQRKWQHRGLGAGLSRPGGKWQVSTDGGDEVRWSGNGRELFYIHGDTMMAVDVKTTPTFNSGTPHIHFKGKYELPGAVPNYAVTPDGQKFIMLKKQADSSPPEVDVVINWAKELQK